MRTGLFRLIGKSNWSPSLSRWHLRHVQTARWSPLGYQMADKSQVSTEVIQSWLGMIDHLLLSGRLGRNIFDEATGVHLQIKTSRLDTTGENLAKAKLLLEEIGPRLRRYAPSKTPRKKLSKELLQFQKNISQAFGARSKKSARGTNAETSGGRSRQKDAAILETEKAMGTLEKEETQSYP